MSTEALTERQILCKINSVLIPGVNDDHLAEVSRVVQGLGAFTHNVMPLISEPEHGTHFGDGSSRVLSHHSYRTFVPTPNW